MDGRYETAQEPAASRRLSQEDGTNPDANLRTPASLNIALADERPETERRDAPAQLPDILPSPSLDFDLSSFISSSAPKSPRTDKVNKRASNVQKLAEENEKLKAELKAMTDRLEAAERRRERLQKREHKEQHIMEP